ncbi:hypothetical protein HZA38_04360 [Candidatus Peregrinibacteria bacterium]|nr:hypothetical protein [Candidatus Peregrinibacteria bacterium]
MGIPKNVMRIETLGGNGVRVEFGRDNTVETRQCLVSTKKLSHHAKLKIFPAEKVKKIVETTGAGDAFRAGFLSGLAKGMKFDNAIQNGIKLGAKCVMLPSGQY